MPLVAFLFLRKIHTMSLIAFADIILNSMQIRREICTMKLIKHPNVVGQYEVGSETIFHGKHFCLDQKQISFSVVFA
jgi:hypothetical protein